MKYGEKLLLESVQAEDERRAREIAARWALYDGDHPKPLKVTPAKNGKPTVDDNVTPNLVRLFVDKGVSFLMGKPPSFALDVDDDDREAEGDVKVSPEELHLDAVWRYNRRKTLLGKWALNGGVTGDAFLKIVIPANPRVDAKTGLALPRLVNLDPAAWTMEWDEDDIERILAYKGEWAVMRDGRPAIRRQLIKLNDDEATWSIEDYLATAAGGTFELIEEPVEWPYEFSPIVHAQNLPRPNEVYGASDMEGGVQELNAAVNRALSNLARIVRFHAHPKTWASGIGTKELAQVVVDPEGIIGLPHPEAELHNLEMSSDLEAALSVFDRLKTLVHELGRVPDLSTDKLEGLGQMSGLALRILYGPLLELTETKQGTYGDALEETNRRLLAIAELGEYDPSLTVNIGWVEAVPSDGLQEAQELEAHNRLGASKHTILEKLGYDPEQEKERREDEAEAAMEDVQRAFDRGEGAGGREQPEDEGGDGGDDA